MNVLAGELETYLAGNGFGGLPLGYCQLKHVFYQLDVNVPLFDFTSGEHSGLGGDHDFRRNFSNLVE